MKPIATKDAPAAIGPYSQAIRMGNFVFLSGQIPLDPATGQMIDGDDAFIGLDEIDDLDCRAGFAVIWWGSLAHDASSFDEPQCGRRV